MQCVRYSVESGDAESDHISACGCHVDGVTEPLSTGRPTQIVAASRIGRTFQVDAIGAVAIPTPVDRSDVIGDALAACVVVFGLNRAGEGGWGAAVRPFGCQNEIRQAKQQSCA